MGVEGRVCWGAWESTQEEFDVFGHGYWEAAEQMALENPDDEEKQAKCVRVCASERLRVCGCARKSVWVWVCVRVRVSMRVSMRVRVSAREGVCVYGRAEVRGLLI